MSLDAELDTAIATQLERLSYLQYGIEASAVIVAALSGMVAARSKRMDLVGTYIVAFVNAFGGGTLRDLLLDRRPLFWVNYPIYPVILFGLSLFFVYVPWNVPRQPLTRWLFDFVDALGLALFSMSGASFALAYQMPYFVVSLIGVITGVFGGVLRDVLLAEIPIIFKTETSLYATCSFIGCWVFLTGIFFNLSPINAAFLGFSITVISRMISIQYQVTLPTPHYLKRESATHKARSSAHLKSPLDDQ